MAISQEDEDSLISLLPLAHHSRPLGELDLPLCRFLKGTGPLAEAGRTSKSDPRGAVCLGCSLMSRRTRIGEQRAQLDSGA